MPTFIDESGNIGAKKDSRPHFRLAAVLFERTSLLEHYSDRLSALRFDLWLEATFEFHFAKIGHELRMAFFDAIAKVVAQGN